MWQFLATFIFTYDVLIPMHCLSIIRKLNHSGIKPFGDSIQYGYRIQGYVCVHSQRVCKIHTPEHISNAPYPLVPLPISTVKWCKEKLEGRPLLLCKIFWKYFGNKHILAKHQQNMKCILKYIFNATHVCCGNLDIITTAIVYWIEQVLANTSVSRDMTYNTESTINLYLQLYQFYSILQNYFY